MIASCKVSGAITKYPPKLVSCQIDYCPNWKRRSRRFLPSSCIPQVNWRIGELYAKLRESSKSGHLFPCCRIGSLLFSRSWQARLSYVGAELAGRAFAACHWHLKTPTNNHSISCNAPIGTALLLPLAGKTIAHPLVLRFLSELESAKFSKNSRLSSCGASG